MQKEKEKDKVSKEQPATIKEQQVLEAKDQRYGLLADYLNAHPNAEKGRDRHEMISAILDGKEQWPTDCADPVKNWVCADCGHEQGASPPKCEVCGSMRVVLKSVIEEHFGPNWKKNFEGKK